VVAGASRNTRAQLLLAAFPNCLSPADTREQLRARQALFPPAAAPTENKWNKGLQGAR